MINFNPQDEEGKASQERDEFLDRVTIDDFLETAYAVIDKEFTELKLRLGSEKMYLQERQNAIKKN